MTATTLAQVHRPPRLIAALLPVLILILLASPPAAWGADPPAIPSTTSPAPALLSSNAPLQVFLYVDPHQVRKEILLRPALLQNWIDLGLDALPSLTVSNQSRVKQSAADFLAVMNPVTIDGQSPQPRLDRIDFLESTPGQPRPIDPPRVVNLASDWLGLSFSYPLSLPPRHVFMEWELFHDTLPVVPAWVADEQSGLPASLDAANPVLEWRRDVAQSPAAAWVELSPPRRATLPLPLPTLVCLLAASGWMAWRGRRRLLTAGRWPALLLVMLAVLLVPFGHMRFPHPLHRVAMPDPAEELLLVQGLLRNLYRAFDHREEERIYDALSRTVTGPLLERLYLETLRSLQLEEQGGARVRVNQVELVESETSPLRDGSGFLARCTWRVSGSVAHWGHVHERRNRYRANLSIRDLQGAWTITDLELIGEERQ